MRPARPVLVPYQEHVPPDVTACIFWLKNRRPVQWRDLHDQRHMAVTKTEEQLPRKSWRICGTSGYSRTPGSLGIAPDTASTK